MDTTRMKWYQQQNEWTGYWVLQQNKNSFLNDDDLWRGSRYYNCIEYRLQTLLNNILQMVNDEIATEETGQEILQRTIFFSRLNSLFEVEQFYLKLNVCYLTTYSYQVVIFSHYTFGAYVWFETNK